MSPGPANLQTMQGPLRKVVHATLFEAIAIVVVAAFMLLVTDHSLASATGLSVATSVVAMLWNMAFNSLFERWEQRQPSKARTVRRRAAHALFYEGGLVLMTVPMIAWWMDMGWWQALAADLVLVAFFLVYTFVFNWVFDRVFGLPAALR
jgi:uncharacterized membrane protein